LIALITPQEIEKWLQEGITAAKAGEYQQARFRLLDVVEQDRTNETAWYWLYQVFDRQDDKRVCLENLVIINPDNRWAKQELLNHLEAYSSPSLKAQPRKKKVAAPAPVRKAKQKVATIAQPRPITLKLVIAFWAGISTIFLMAGIISAGTWIFNAFGGESGTAPVSPFRLLELVITISFIVGGILGLCIAVALFVRSVIGFYGSLFLALSLLLIGPIVSLITRPPNYASLICIGGIAGMIVLLTLASHSGLRNATQDALTSK
jgi:hypothetical protein